MEEKTYEYPSDEITVLWKPHLCIHSEKCVNGLPKVFRPKDKPWIQTENADDEDLAKQIRKCPSGALGIKSEEAMRDSDEKSGKFEVTLIPNGPLMCEGNFTIKNSDGNTEEKTKAALCRCGASSNKPFCDGSHTKVDFKAS